MTWVNWTEFGNAGCAERGITLLSCLLASDLHLLWDPLHVQ